METLKVKSIFFSLLAILTISVFMTSCEQDTLEDLNPVVENTTVTTDIDERQAPTAIPAEILGKWKRSHEEETGPYLVYRPASWNLPPVRGVRTSLDFKPDNKFTYGYSSPNDLPAYKSGVWAQFSPTFVATRVRSSKFGPWEPIRTFNIVEITHNKLVIYYN